MSYDYLVLSSFKFYHFSNNSCLKCGMEIHLILILTGRLYQIQLLSSCVPVMAVVRIGM